MSERWTLMIDDEGPTSATSDESEDRTLLIGDTAPRSHKRAWASLPSGLSRLPAQHGYLLLGVLGGAALGFFVALGTRACSTGEDLRRGVYPVPCAEADAVADQIAPAVAASATKLDDESRNESLDAGPMARRAADLLVANRYREALAMYRRLAGLHPEDVVFLHLSSLLESKLRCDSSASLGGGACN